MVRRLIPLALAGVLVACGGTGATGGDGDEAGAATATTAPPATAAVVATPAPTAATAPAAPDATSGAVVADVPEALQFSAPLVGGGEIDLAGLAGPPVLLWFWAPW